MNGLAPQHSAEVSSVISKSAASYYDPYRRGPMMWDSERSTIGFMGVDPKRKSLDLSHEVFVTL